MKKILMCLCLLVGYGMANDRSGAILGVEFGLNEVDLKASAQGVSGNIKLSAPVYGFKAGYKHFFTDLIGLQGYFSFKDSFINANAKIDSSNISVSGSGSAHFMPIMANADVIFDFYKSNDVSLDAIIGVGVGVAMVNYKNKAIEALTIPTITENFSGFYGDARVGLGVNASNNRIGLVASFPFNSVNKTIYSVKLKVKQNYAVSLTYDYTF